MALSPSNNEDIWIFGYGSLIWKVDFDHEEAMVGFVRGYARRFYQGSTDHRGVPGSPGRVVTLLPDDASVTYGVAYRVAAKNVDAVMSYLDYREKGGYERMELEVLPHNNSKTPVRALVYTCTDANSNWLGPAAEDAIALQVFHSTGPSGPNREYVLKLAEAMRSIAPGVRDAHLDAIEDHLQRLIDAHASA
eukprot:m.30144 g.30144  ORF g.30144 m.30144 type:complete len:192 (+) comp4749_c0_seq2:2107-2682(+)